MAEGNDDGRRDRQARSAAEADMHHWKSCYRPCGMIRTSRAAPFPDSIIRVRGIQTVEALH